MVAVIGIFLALGSVSAQNTAPTANLNVNVSSPTNSDTVKLNGSGSSDSDGSIASLEYDFTYDGVYDATGNSTVYTYSSDGSYIPYLRATDNDGATSTDTASFTIDTQAPQKAEALTPAGSISNSKPPIEGNFTDNLNITEITFNSEYQEGSGSISQTYTDLSGTQVSRTFNSYVTTSGLQEGLHTYSWEVFDEAGNSATFSENITVDTVKPTVSIDSISEGETLFTDTVSLNASSSEDANFSYDSGTPKNVSVVENDRDLNVTVSGLADGSNTIIVYANDSAGNVGSDSVTFNVDTGDLSLAIASPLAGETVSSSSFFLNATASSSSTFIYNVDGGSNTTVTEGDRDLNISISGISDGSHTINLFAEDTNGRTASVSRSFSKNTNSPPTASFTATTSDLTVNADASGSSDGDGSIPTFEWDWTNDGTYDASGLTASKTYDFEGTYDVKLRVTDDDGASSTSTQSVSVSSSTSGGGDTDTGPTEVAFTIDNVGSSAWVVENDSTGVAGDGENPDINLEQGKRYTIRNNGYGAYGTHPLEFFDSNGDALLSQSSTGDFEDNPDVNWVDNGDTVSFTVTQSLYDSLSGYICTVHISMEGNIVQETSTSPSGGGGGGGGSTTDDDDDSLSATSDSENQTSSGGFLSGATGDLPFGENIGLGALVVVALLAFPIYSFLK